MFPERFLPKKHRFVVRFQSKALAYTHMALLKERGILELSRTINIPLLLRNSRVQDLERKTNNRIEQVGKGGLPPLFPDH